MAGGFDRLASLSFMASGIDCRTSLSFMAGGFDRRAALSAVLITTLLFLTVVSRFDRRAAHTNCFRCIPLPFHIVASAFYRRVAQALFGTFVS